AWIGSIRCSTLLSLSKVSSLKTSALPSFFSFSGRSWSSPQSPCPPLTGCSVGGWGSGAFTWGGRGPRVPRCQFRRPNFVNPKAPFPSGTLSLGSGLGIRPSFGPRISDLVPFQPLRHPRYNFRPLFNQRLNRLLSSL